MNYEKPNELDWYDNCSALKDFVPERSDETQTVTYEDFRLASRQPFFGPVFDDDDKIIQQILPVVVQASIMTMNNLAMYAGGGGAEGTNFARDSRTIYLTMRDDPMKQRIEGFGQFDFLKLLGTRLTGEAREVHNAHRDEWKPGDRSNPNFRRARRAERKRAIWRIYRRDRSTYLSLRSQSGFDVEPAEPDFPEPADLEDFLFDLQDRFRSSTSQNLASIHDFQAKKNEGLEQMFAST